MSAASSAARTEVSITVSTRVIGAPIDAHFAGLSYEKGYLARPFFTVNNRDAVALFARLGRNLVRIGGGTCDDVLWTPNGGGRTIGQVAKSDVDRLAGFLEATGWDAVYCVNLKSSTPAVAAEEAAYVTRALGGHLAGIEIGNEPDNYGHGGSKAGFGPTQYAQKWRAFAGAIHGAVPNVVLTGPDLAELAHDSSWLPPLLGGSPRPGIATQHFYASEIDRHGSIGTLITPSDIPYAQLARLAEDAKKSGVPYRLSETSTFWGGGIAGVSDAFASALWAIDYLFAIAIRDGRGANFHSIGTHPNDVLADMNGKITEVRPIYYGLLFFVLAGEGRVVETVQDAHGLDVTAHAIQSSDGSTKVLVLNKTSGHPITFQIKLGHPARSASMRVLGARALDATTGVTIQGSSVGLDGGFSPRPATPLSVRGAIVSGTLSPASAGLVDVH